MSMHKLLDCICALASRLPPVTASQVAGALRAATMPVQREAALRNAMQSLHPDNRNLLQQLATAWEQQLPSVTGAEVASALESAAHQEQSIAGRTSIELVWSGPATPNAGLRGTEQVLLELISTAKESIYLVTFAAYRVPSLVAALQAAAARGVRIVFVLEDKDESAGKVSLNAFPALSGMVRGSAKAYVWPLEQRSRNEKGQHGSLHAKFVVADSCRLFVSSANLTDFALTLNIELGVLLNGGDAPRQAEENLNELIRTDVLKEMCVVP